MRSSLPQPCQWHNDQPEQTAAVDYIVWMPGRHHPVTDVYFG
jgi:hypothetical protein